jgi:hypothetical protein
MTPTELLESVRRVEVRTNRLVNDTMDTMVGAFPHVDETQPRT